MSIIVGICQERGNFSGRIAPRSLEELHISVTLWLRLDHQVMAAAIYIKADVKHRIPESYNGLGWKGP